MYETIGFSKSFVFSNYLNFLFLILMNNLIIITYENAGK